MSEEKAESSLPPSGTATPKGKLDTLSREDLVKFVKRQTMLLQKMKAKNSELEARASEPQNTKGESESESSVKDAKIKELEEKLQETLEEKGEAVAAYNSVQASQAAAAEQIQDVESRCMEMEKEREQSNEKFSMFENKNKALMEEIECMKMKDETLTSTLQCLQLEQATLMDSNKILVSEKSSLQIKLEDFEEEARAWNEEKKSLLAEFASSGVTAEQVESLEQEKKELQTRVENLLAEKGQVEEHLNSCQVKEEQRKEQIDLLQQEISRLNDEEQSKNDLAEKLAEANKHIRELLSNSESQGNENESKEKEMISLVNELDESKRSAECARTEFTERLKLLETEINKMSEEKEVFCQTIAQLESAVQRVKDENTDLLKGIDERAVEMSQTTSKLEEISAEKDKLFERVNYLETKLEETDGQGTIGDEAQHLRQLENVKQELERTRSKLSDYETTLGEEFSINVIQNLQQELAEAKMKLSELESNDVVDGHGDHCDVPVVEQLNPVCEKEEAETDCEHPGSSETGVPDGQVYTETIQRTLQVSTHVAPDGNLSCEDNNTTVDTLKARVAELEAELRGLRYTMMQQKESQTAASLNGSQTLQKEDAGEASYAEQLASVNACRQHLEEKLVVLGDKYETLTFELEEVQAERDTIRSEMEPLQQQLAEWENLMEMLKNERDQLAQELEEANNKDEALRKELEFLLSSLNEAINERDSLQDEVFKMQDGSAMGEMQEMKSVIDDILKERTRLLSELDAVLMAKADAAIVQEGLRRELDTMRAEKEEIERAKESLSVCMELAQQKESNMSEDFSAQLEKCNKTEQDMNEVKEQMEFYKTESHSLKERVETAEKKAAEAEGVAEEKINYAQELESQILQLSNTLSESKNQYWVLKDQFDEVTSNNADLSRYREQVEDLQTQLAEAERVIQQLKLDQEIISGEKVKLDVQISDMSEVEKELKNRVGELEEEKNSIQQRLGEKEKYVIDLGQEVEAWKAKEQELLALLSEKAEREEVQNGEKDVSDRIVKDLEGSLKEMQDEKEEMERKWTQATADGETLDFKLKEVQENFETANRERAELLEKVNAQSSMLEDADRKLGLREQTISELTKEVEVLQRDREELVEKSHKEEIATSKLTDIEENHVLLMEKINQLESSLTTKEEEIRSLKEHSGGLEIKVTELTSQLQELSQMNEDMKNETGNLEKEKQSLSKLVDETEEKCRELLVKIESVTADFDNVTLEREHLNAKLEEVKIDFTEKLEQEKQVWVGELGHAKEELEKEKEMHAEELEKSQSKQEDLEGKVKSLMEEMEQVKAISDQLSIEKQNSASELEALKSESTIQRSEAGANEEALAQLTNRLTNSAEEVANLSSQLEEFKKEKEELLYRKTELESYVKTAEEEQDTLRSTVFSLKSQLTETEDVLSAATAECNELKVNLAELEKLKEEEKHQTSSEHDPEVSKLKAQLKEKEDINNKLKQLAIKSKKELGEKQNKMDTLTAELTHVKERIKDLQVENQELQRQSGSSTDALTEELNTCRENYKQIQDSFDKSQDELEKQKTMLATAQNDIEQLVEQLAEVKGQVASSQEDKAQVMKLTDTLRADIKTREGHLEELRTKLKVTETELGAVRIQLSQINKDKGDLEAKLKAAEDEHKVRLVKVETELTEARNQLTTAMQSATQSSMMDLEIADYERTMSAMHTQVAERDKTVEELKGEINKLEQRISLMQTQISAGDEQRTQSEDRANKLKQLLVKTKKDLADAKKLELVQKASEAQLRGQLESSSQQMEELKVQFAELASEKQRLADKVSNINDSGQRTVRSLESKVQSLTDELEMVRGELKTIQAEYDGYKVRAQTVLRQQKSKGSVESNNETEKKDQVRLENAIEVLKTKLHEAQEQLETTIKDGEQVSEDHHHLMQRHTRLLRDLEERETSSRLRLEQVMKEKEESIAEMQEKLSFVEAQRSKESKNFKDQVLKLHEENDHKEDVLQKQLDSLEMDNVRLQQEIQHMQRMGKGGKEDFSDMSQHEFFPITSHPVEERQEGEGSEVVETEPVKNSLKRANPANSFTFEQLISTPMENLPGIKSPTPSVDEESLKSELVTSQKRIEHLSEVLSESESSVLRLTEQAKILKDEIRRLERNTERERETQNMEYLKNIFLQFVCPKVGEQRAQLVPVLTTMLKLSPDEKARIQAVAQGEDAAQQGAAQAAGWGAYLHRWSGLT